MLITSVEVFGEDTRTVLSLGMGIEQLKGQPTILYISFFILCIYLLTLKPKYFVHKILHSFII